jgi:hypothetical protein
MLSQKGLQEFQSTWLPNISDQGLDRLLALLEKGSPLLIQGSFTRALPQGCLATHIAWNHPRTTHLTVEAGVTWLNQVAGLNPATSHVIREWDASRGNDFEVRAQLAEMLRQERQQRLESGATQPHDAGEFQVLCHAGSCP